MLKLKTHSGFHDLFLKQYLIDNNIFRRLYASTEYF
jgi:hypothetical protein